MRLINLRLIGALVALVALAGVAHPHLAAADPLSILIHNAGSPPP